MASVNDRLISKSISHQVGIERVTSQTVREIMALLNEADRDLMRQLEERLRKIERFGFDRGPATTRRLEAVLVEIRKLAREAYERAGKPLRKALRELGDYEIDFQQRMMADAAGAPFTETSAARFKLKDGELRLNMVRPPSTQMIAAIERSPFQGAIMSRWIEKLATDKADLVMRAVNVGVVEGQTTDQIVRRLIGTKAAGFTDGILDIPRRHAETWVRTATAHVANEARDELYESNSDILEGVTWVSTLDHRVCERCVPPDGHLYSLPDHKPLDGGPAWGAGPGRTHPSCRCTSTPTLASWRKLGLNVDEGPPGLRAAFGGPVSRKMTAEDWLRGHPEAAKTLYGETRAKLFLDGGLSADDLIRKDGTLWTLAELKEREAAAFKAIA